MSGLQMQYWRVNSGQEIIEINDEGHCQGQGQMEGNYPSLAQTSISGHRHQHHGVEHDHRHLENYSPKS